MSATYQDLEHLKLLSIFHYVVGGLFALGGCFPLIYVAIGVMMIVAPESLHDRQTPPEVFKVMGTMFAVFGTLACLLGWAAAIGLVVAGRCLSRHRRYTFCVVMAAIACIFFPFGTVLGVLTLIVLMRPTVKPLFRATSPAADGAA